MNDDQIDDLKQFIATTILRQTSDLREDLESVREDIADIRKDIAVVQSGLKRVDTKIDDLSSAIAESFDTSNEDVDKRLAKLEQQAA